MNDSVVQNALLIAGLIKKYRENSISEEEQYMLFRWRNGSNANRELFSKLMDSAQLENDLEQMEEVAITFHEERILSKTVGMQPKVAGQHRRSPKLKWAVAALMTGIIAGASLLLPFAKRKMQHPETIHPLASKIVPGSNRAVLTLANGSQVVLDTTSQTIKENGNITINRHNGTLVYDASHSAIPSGAAIPWNSIVTPRGGQYQVILPDGTAVWLNAEASISFPTVFTGKERRVSITGEVYFEVAKQLFQEDGDVAPRRMPFVVEVPSPGKHNMQDKMEIVVLGTHFNVNAYPDEEMVRTTLLEGSVIVSDGKAQMKIVPGEQAGTVMGSHKFSSTRPDLTEVLAWKNGVFKFSNTGIASIMRQISRWYDVDIQYEPGLSSTLFSGEISRKDDMHELLEILAGDGRIKFSVDGRIIKVRLAR